MNWGAYKTAVLAAIPVEALASELPGKSNRRGDEIEACCPWHEDDKPSLSISTSKHVVKCHACGQSGSLVDLYGQIRGIDGFRAALEAAGDEYGVDKARFAEQRKAKKGGGGKLGELVATYDYRDASGKIVFHVCRFEGGEEGKTFRQKLPGGKWGLGKVKTVLYRLPELLAAEKPVTIYFVEGEKDADNLAKIGLTATTTPMGSKSWKKTAKHAVKMLADRHVVILPDNDHAGRDYALEVAAALSGKAASVKVLHLPELEDKGDVSDWLEAGGTAVQLAELVVDCPAWVPSGIEEIQTNEREQRDVIDDARKAITRYNGSEPRVFLTGSSDDAAGIMAEIVETATTTQLRPLDTTWKVVELLTRVANWRRKSGAGKEFTTVPHAIAECVSIAPPQNLPLADAVIRAPVFVNGGTLLRARGYCAPARAWFSPTIDVADPPEKPTDADVRHAGGLVSELFQDFPFATSADRTNAVAALLLPMVRRLINGPTPLHVIEASTPGTGKSLLANVISTVATGSEANMTTLPGKRDEEEIRKKITSDLLGGPVMVCWDNVKVLKSETIAAALTAVIWSDRILGANQKVALPVHAAWTATGNNIAMSDEIVRRSVRIRIVAHVERPEDRTDFLHDPILPWVKRHRSELLHALAVLVRRWIAAGRPAGEARMGSYEEWSSVVGGILAAAGFESFLGNRSQLRDDSDHDGAMWRRFYAAWWAEHRDDWVRVPQLLSLAEREEMLGPVLGDGKERAQQTRLGIQLRKLRDRVFGEWTLESRSAKRVEHRLVEIEANLGDRPDLGQTSARPREENDGMF